MENHHEQDIRSFDGIALSSSTIEAIPLFSSEIDAVPLSTDQLSVSTLDGIPLSSSSISATPLSKSLIYGSYSNAPLSSGLYAQLYTIAVAGIEANIITSDILVPVTGIISVQGVEAYIREPDTVRVVSVALIPVTGIPASIEEGTIEDVVRATVTVIPVTGIVASIGAPENVEATVTIIPVTGIPASIEEGTIEDVVRATVTVIPVTGIVASIGAPENVEATVTIIPVTGIPASIEEGTIEDVVRATVTVIPVTGIVASIGAPENVEATVTIIPVTGISASIEEGTIEDVVRATVTVIPVTGLVASIGAPENVEATVTVIPVTGIAASVGAPENVEATVTIIPVTGISASIEEGTIEDVVRATVTIIPVTGIEASIGAPENVEATVTVIPVTGIEASIGAPENVEATVTIIPVTGIEANIGAPENVEATVTIIPVTGIEANIGAPENVEATVTVIPVTGLVASVGAPENVEATVTIIPVTGISASIEEGSGILDTSYYEPVNGYSWYTWSDPGGWTDIDVTTIANVGTGEVDNAPGLKAHIDANAGSKIRYIFPEGTFNFESLLHINRDNKILVGAGRDETVLDFHNAGLIRFQGFDGNTSGITVAPQRGDTTVQVVDASLFIVGEVMTIREDLENTVLGSDDTNAPYNLSSPIIPESWGSQTREQIVRITAIDTITNTITFDEPLALDYNLANNPECKQYNVVYDNGIQDLTVQVSADTGLSTIEFDRAQRCFARNVHINKTAKYGFRIAESYQIEISQCSVVDAWSFGGGGFAYGVNIELGSSGCRVSDSVFDNLRHHIAIQTGASHNVVAYNFNRSPSESSVNLTDFSLHGHYCHHNLIEGNIFHIAEINDFYPRTDHNLFFRNKVLGNPNFWDGDTSSYAFWLRRTSIAGIVANRIETSNIARVFTGSESSLITLNGNVAPTGVPNSKVLTSKPSYWGASDVWPPFAGNADNPIPAELLLSDTLTAQLATIPVTGIEGSVVSDSFSGNPFRLTTYDLASGLNASFELTLNQNLAPDYFIILNGNLNSSAQNNQQQHCKIMSDPFGSGDLLVSSGADKIGFHRQLGSSEWFGSVTVVECLTPNSPDGFRLVSVETPALTLGDTLATFTHGGAFNDYTRGVPFVGLNGPGSHVKHSHRDAFAAGCARVVLTSATQYTLERSSALPGNLDAEADICIFFVEWGSAWTVQSANITGASGGGGINAASEYDSAAISAVNSANAWVYPTGYTDDWGLNSAFPGTAVTLGDGVTVGATETLVSAGTEEPVQKNIQAYVMEHPSLLNEWIFSPGAPGGDRDIAISAPASTETGYGTGAVAGYRLPFLTKSSRGDGTAWNRVNYARTLASAQVFRAVFYGSQAQSWPGWVQNIDFGNFQ